VSRGSVPEHPEEVEDKEGVEEPDEQDDKERGFKSSKVVVKHCCMALVPSAQAAS
jgi:hypothetical protein